MTTTSRTKVLGFFPTARAAGTTESIMSGNNEVVPIPTLLSKSHTTNTKTKALKFSHNLKNSMPHHQTMCSCFRSKQDVQTAAKKAAPPPPSGSPSLDSISAQLRDVVVRVVHAGGRIEMYEAAVPAARLIRRNPGMCIATPDVFQRPDDAVLSPDDMLLPGNKYFVVRSTTVEKLRRRRRLSSAIGAAADEAERSEESVSDKDYAVARDGWSILKKRMKEKKKFVPPIQRPMIWKESDWEPSLTSIKELSP